MSFGKMNTFIEILETKVEIDEQGFGIKKEETIAKVRAYKEERHGGEKWATMAVFSEATVLFRFRWIPNVRITTEHVILNEGIWYNIISVENVKGRNMYIEALATKVEPSS